MPFAAPRSFDAPRVQFRRDLAKGCNTADLRASRSIVHYGLVLCFPHRSAKIEPFPTEPILAGNGGGWIDLGLVVMDRKRVRSAAVFA
jgi:hypothetical protein